MPLCGSGEATPLEQHSRWLAEQKDIGANAPALRFPMYTVPLPQLMDMQEIDPHEVLMDKGTLVEFSEGLGRAAFVSHQWVGENHPDPECKQLRVLQDALNHLMSDMQYINLDLNTEFVVAGARRLEARIFRQRPLYIWYDYFSCPQLDLHARRSVLQSGMESSSENVLASAIESIPGYIARCSFFFALCPVVYNASQVKVFTPYSWADRGWCRAERACRELSSDASWIMVKSRTELELIATQQASIGGSPGEGAFTVDSDRVKLGGVVQQAIKRKLLIYLQKHDLVGYRVLLNLQSVHLRGFPIEPVDELVPKSEAALHSSSLAVPAFLYQNGFRDVSDADKRGWSPLHYAALTGRADLLRSLLDHRANINRTTKKDQPLAGVPPSTSALAICVMFKHNDAAQMLVAARAKVGHGLLPDICLAAMAGNAPGIRLLCEAGCKPETKDLLGFTPFDAACGAGSLEAMEELLKQAEYNIDVSKGLFVSMSNRGGKAEVVDRLVSLRADINMPFKQPSMSIYGIILRLGAMQHRLGKITLLSRLAYHGHGATPVMLAVMTGQYEGAAALLAAGAELDLRNYRNRTVADFAREQSVPHFLREGLEGRIDDAREIADAALAGSIFRI